MNAIDNYYLRIQDIMKDVFDKEYENIEDIPQTYFYIVKFSAIDIKLKAGKIDFLETDNINISTFVLTQHLFNLFKSNYTYTRIRIKKIIAFKTRKGLFDNLPIKAFDIVEVSPKLDCNDITSWLALKTIYEVFKYLGDE